MRARRTVLIKLPRGECDVGYIKRLMALANLAYRDYEVLAPDIPKTIQNQLYDFKNYTKSLVFGVVPKRWFARTWVPLKTLRVYGDGSMKGDRSAPVVLDFRGSVIKLRRVCRNKFGYFIELPMPKWVIERVKEGGDIKFARIGLRNNEPYLTLVAERVVEPYEPSDYMLVIDVNSWSNGITWGLIKSGNIIKWKPERPNLREIDNTYNLSVVLSRKYGALRKIGLGETEEGGMLWHGVRNTKRRLYAKLRDHAQKLAHRLAKKALRHRALVIIDDMIEESRRELLEEKIPSGLAKTYLAGLREFVRLLTTQLRWYGVPYRFRRLPSTICPVCQSELTQVEGRTMVCNNCGFKAPRDLVPMYWAVRLTQ
ncbi:MAG: zinc ribbon domain-containing protein [Vulcanisaeta sp.]|nr:zinc ribbon domain-containing protein [Vulcanisaeta sp.]